MSFTARPRVFISYARTDGEAFATTLRHRLEVEEPEITLWHDRAQMEGGVGWWKQIEEALDKVKFLVIVMTPAAMASEITRREWRHARRKGVVVYPVKGVADDVIDYASLPNWMRKAHFFDIGKEWVTFTNYLKSDRQPMRVPFMAPEMPKPFVPRPREFEAIIDLVLDRTNQNPVAITTSLQGAGGYGKTTLATALCHDDRVLDAFDDGILWVTLGQTPNVISELEKVYDALTGEQGGFVDVEHGTRKVAEKLEHQNCLIVIDDVWDQAHAEPFLRGGDRCARLLTTRRLDVESRAARVPVDEMTSVESVAVLATAFEHATAPAALLQPLARRLGEWPLLLRLTAGMLRRRLTRGDSAEGAVSYVGKALDKHGVTAFDSVRSSEREKTVALTVAASRDLLSQQDRRRLAELAIFPEEAHVPLTTLARLWGLDELDTEECAQRLDDVALVVLDLRQGTLAQHDVMRAFLLRELDDAPRLHGALTAGYGDLMHLPDAYAWRWLPYHLAQAGKHERLRALLLDPMWLKAQLTTTDVNTVVRSFDEAGVDSDLAVIQRALRLSIHVLASSSDQLAEQLHGRLRPGASEALDHFRSGLTRLEPRPRLHGRWPNLEGSGSSLLQVLTGHERSVTGVQLLPNGRALSWSGDGTLRVWDLAAGSAQVLTGHESWIRGAQLLPDGRALSWGGDGTLRVWDLGAGSAHVLAGHEGPVHGAQLLADGRALSWGDDYTLRVWDLAAGSAQVLTGHEGWVNGAQLLPDGRALSWSDDRTLRVWDLLAGSAQVLTGHEGRVHGAQLLADGRALSWGGDGTLRVWDLVAGSAQVLTGHERSVTGARLLSDGRALSWGGDGTLRVWDLAAGSAEVLTGHKGWVTGAQLLSDGRALSWGGDGTLRLWDLGAGSAQVLTGHESSVHGAQLLPDGRALSWGDDRTLRVWDLAVGSAQVLTGHEDWITGARLLPDGRALSWSDDRTLRVWDLAVGSAQVLTGHEGWVNGAQLLPDGRALSWSDDRTLRVWDLAAGSAQVLTGHEGWVTGAQLLPDGRALSWGRDGTLRVWDIGSGSAEVLTGHERWVTGAQLLPDGRTLSWGGDGTLRVWDIGSGSAQVLTGHERTVTGAQLLPDGRALSWSEDRTLRVWDLGSGSAQVLTGHRGWVNGAQLLPDGRALSWSEDGTLRVWDLSAGIAEVLSGHKGSVHGAQLLSDGRALSWGEDGTLRLWDLGAGSAQVLTGHDRWIRGAQLLPDGRALSWGGDGTLRVWDLRNGSAQALTGHEGPVHGAQLLLDGQALSWGRDRTLRVWDLARFTQVARFDFDATPNTIVECLDCYFVADALGRVHFLEWLA